MRRGEAAAFAEFVERYQRLLLHYARRAGLRGDDADELVITVLGDAAVAFVEPGARMPNDVALYLIGCFRNRLLNERRDGERRARRVAEVSTDGDWGDGGERAALCSEDARRASRGPAWEAPPPAAAGLTALSRMLSESLSADERQMLAWDSEDVPQREIAERLGITHAAVRQRLHRLRARLRAASEQYAATLDGDSGRVVRRFLRRSIAVPRAASQPAAAAASTKEGARQRRAEPGPLADGAGQEPRGEGGRRDE
jgi:RNA polymerase sigma factor (sigma-70 family)